LPEAVRKEDRRIPVNLALIAAAIALLAALYAPVVSSLVRQYIDDPNYRHGILVPFVSALLLWRKRTELSSATGGGKESFGLVIITFSSLLLIAGTAAVELFSMRVSLPLMIVGTVLLLRGWNFAKSAAPPLLLTLLMVPLPYIIYYKITFPMQLLSARLSASILAWLNVSVIRRGNILALPGYTLEVVAACSGLRSIMTMFTIAVVFAIFSDMSRSRKFILVLLSLPAAIAANTVRLVVTGLGAYLIGPGFADGPLHEASGMIVFLAGLMLLIVCAGLLRWTQFRRKRS
jgi:exosortase